MGRDCQGDKLCLLSGLWSQGLWLSLSHAGFTASETRQGGSQHAVSWWKMAISLFLFLQFNTIFFNAFNILSLVSNISLKAILELMRCRERRAWSLTQHFKLHFTVSTLFNGRWGSNLTEYHCNNNSSYCAMYVASERERHIIFHLGQSAWLSFFGKLWMYYFIYNLDSLKYNLFSDWRFSVMVILKIQADVPKHFGVLKNTFLWSC